MNPRADGAGTVPMPPPKSLSPKISGTTIVVDADALSMVTEFLEVPAHRVTNALRSFLTTTQQIEPAWGSGEIGGKLELQYRPGYKDLATLLKDLVEGLGSVGGTFTVAANNVLYTEEVNQT
jgi:hypothetical protein